MEIQRTLKRTIAKACLVALWGAFGAGCSAETTDEGASTDAKANANANANGATGSNATDAKTHRVRASSATKDEYGVDAWVVEANGGAALVQGFDESGALRVRFEQTVTTNTAGEAHGEISANVDGAPRFEYVVSADGNGTVTRNDFPSHLRAVDAALAALADFQRGGVDLVRTNGLEAKDLTTGNPTLVSGSHCAAAIAATMCIIASMCGLGGDAGANLLATVVEAGTSQECH